jgi:phosphoribosyl 1,2-cyclic phosphate phosphodiesterase
MGMDDLRRFVDLRGGEALPVYSSAEGLERVRTIFPYAIHDKPISKGYPAFSPRPMPSLLELPGGTVQATYLPHGPIEVLGLVFTEAETGKRLAFYTDCKRLTREAEELARGADVVVLDALRPNPHPSHMTIDEAISAAAVRARWPARTYLTHMTFKIDHARDSARLPGRHRVCLRQPAGAHLNSDFSGKLRPRQRRLFFHLRCNRSPILGE